MFLLGSDLRGLLGPHVLALSVAASACDRHAPPLAGPPHEGSSASGREAGTAPPGSAAAAGAATPGDDGSASTSEERDASLAPLPPDPLFTNLTVTGYPEAVVSVPNGATSRRPVLVVLHGSGDRPDWNCDAWRHITSAQGFVLCPRGRYVPNESTKDDARFTHRGGAYLQSHVDAALEALGARFGDYADVAHPILAGFSLGATEVAQLAIGSPERFARVAQVEGGDAVWNQLTIRSFAEGGGATVLLACGSAWCLPKAKAAAARLEKGGIGARVVSANVGHTTDRPLQEAIMSELAWWLDGDPRWKTARPAH